MTSCSHTRKKHCKKDFLFVKNEKKDEIPSFLAEKSFFKFFLEFLKSKIKMLQSINVNMQSRNKNWWLWKHKEIFLFEKKFDLMNTKEHRKQTMKGEKAPEELNQKGELNRLLLTWTRALYYCQHYWVPMWSLLIVDQVFLLFHQGLFSFASECTPGSGWL